MDNPYRLMPDYCFWQRAVSDTYPTLIDPCTEYVSINKNEKVSTIGSCFAQHISRKIEALGLSYFVPEASLTTLTKEENFRKNFGIFSARYGNVYTPRQALQLLQRAYGVFTPIESSWRNKRGQWIDPFRPFIEPDGFSSPESVRIDRESHFDAVKRICEESSWIVFTLGLTEAWDDTRDGAVYPFAPGVVSEDFESKNCQPKNFTISETIEDISNFISFVRSRNDNVKFIFTVSPVPLIATHQKRHVMVSTFSSKAVLRASCEEVLRKFDNVWYFPSYEIIMSPIGQGRYFEDDLREVNEHGVTHVMRVFQEHFIEPVSRRPEGNVENMEISHISDPYAVICDENQIIASLKNLKTN